MDPGQTNEQAGKIDFAQKQPNRRHDDIFNKRRHNFAECRADDNADREVDHIPLNRKFFKLLKQGHLHFPLPEVGVAYNFPFIEGSERDSILVNGFRVESGGCA